MGALESFLFGPGPIVRVQEALGPGAPAPLPGPLAPRLGLGRALRRGGAPLSLLLSGQVYVRLTLPDPPPIDVIRERLRESVREMGPAEREYALANAKVLGEYVRVVEEEVSAAVRTPVLTARSAA